MATPLTTDQILSRLIAFDTTSRNSNLALVEYIADYLDAHGVRTKIMSSPEGDKANLFATLGPEDVSGVLLSGHTDVVPANEQDWKTHPFRASRRDNKIYGRGTCDMKGYIASALALVPKAISMSLKRPIQFAFSYDEELGCIGGKRLASFVATLPTRPAACIVGEPTSMRIATRHKGKKWFCCHVRGCEGHSSAPDLGVNAINAAADVIVSLRDLYERIKREGPFDSTFEPPHTTIHTGLIRGGTSYNVIPRECEFEFEFRHLPEHDPAALLEHINRIIAERILPGMKRVSPQSEIRLDLLSEYPGLCTDEDDPIITFVKGMLDQPETTRIGFSTEAGLFQQTGTPTLICGPGDIAQAHKPNEFVSVEQLDRCDRFLRRILQSCGTGNDFLSNRPR